MQTLFPLFVWAGLCRRPVLVDPASARLTTIANRLVLFLLLMSPVVVPAQSTVNLATGGYTYSHVDFQIPTSGPSFGFKRCYNSQNTANGGGSPWKPGSAVRV
jgi:hypothetical protein